MTPQKWQLLSVKDISPHKWFPLEMRKYQLPNGRVVDDFSVTTLADVAMIVAVTKEGKLVMVRQFKPGFGDVIVEFPAGRIENSHKNLEETAQHELEEETGILAEHLEYFGTIAGFVTKGTEKVHCFFTRDAEFNSQQKLDDNEEIEIVLFSPEEFDELIDTNQIQAALTIAAWRLAKTKYFNLK